MGSVSIGISAVLLGEVGSVRMIHSKKKAKEAWGWGAQRAVLGAGKMSWMEPMTSRVLMEAYSIPIAFG